MKFKKPTRNHLFLILAALILLSAAFFRIHDFQSRVMGFNSDVNRDVMISREALIRHELPFYGTFSSAGAFVIGPTFFWMIMLSLILFPNNLYAPWIMAAIVSIVTVIVLMRVGFLISGRKLAIIAGILAATSPQLIGRSMYLTNPSMVAPIASCILLFFVLAWKTKKLKHMLFMGLCIGLAVSLHYQAVNLLIFLPALLFIPGLKLKQKALGILLGIVGTILPLIPLLYWDALHSAANIRNALDYMLIAQYRVYIPNSWKIFLSQVLPINWANIIGGNILIAIPLMTITGLYFCYNQIRSREISIITVLGAILFLLLVLNRYYKGEHFDGYMIYFIPFIIIISGWAITKIFFEKKHIVISLIGVIVMSIIVLGNLQNAQHFFFSDDQANNDMQNIAKKLFKKYPNTYFKIYDNKHTLMYSLGVSNYLAHMGKTRPNGHPIGFTNTAPESKKLLIATQGNVYIIDLSKSKQHKNKKMWSSVNQEDIYEELLVQWWVNNLPSTFDLAHYIQEKITGKKH